jgi:hypothetical protein
MKCILRIKTGQGKLMQTSTGIQFRIPDDHNSYGLIQPKAWFLDECLDLQSWGCKGDGTRLQATEWARNLTKWTQNTSTGRSEQGDEPATSLSECPTQNTIKANYAMEFLMLFVVMRWISCFGFNYWKW